MKLRTTTFALLLTSVLSGQFDADRIHWYLRDRMSAASVDQKLPVYFVMRERLGRDHWFPRVRRMSVDERRSVVMRELRAHAEDTQREVWAFLAECVGSGDVDGMFCNWLGNFIQCAATPEVIRQVTAFDGVAELRFDASWPIEEVEDAAPVRPLTGSLWGYGPIHMRSNEVWRLGFRGEGVIVMNADSGINVDYEALINRMWINPGEIAGNGIDDDSNGFVDDVNGWNFFDNNNDIQDDPDSYHGTLTAGCVAADGTCFNGLQLGQAPGAMIMTAKLGKGPAQSGPINPASEVAQWNAVQYAIQMGAHIQTSAHSYKNGFVPPPNYRMHREIADSSLAAGLIRTNSTSNNGSRCNRATDPNRMPFNIAAPGNMPPPYLDPNQTLRGATSGVIGVGAHDIDDNTLDPNTPCGPTSWFLDDLLAVLPTYPTANWSASHNDYPWTSGTQMGLLKPDVTGPIDTVGIISVQGSTCQAAITGGTSTATPRVAGCIAQWKQANMSLTPEDVAMVLHQAAVPSGSVQGKENGWGAGRVDALDGLLLALCTHRVEGQPAWQVDAQVGGTVRWGLDTVPNSAAFVLLGTQRTALQTGGGVLGLGGQVAVALIADSGTSGDVSFDAFISPVLSGLSIYSQCFVDDTTGVTGRLLSSNVIETRFVM